MNKNRYRLVFSKKLSMLVAVAETTNAHHRTMGGVALTNAGLGVGLLALSLAISNVFAQTNLLSTNSLPVAPRTTAGSATYVTSGKTLTVTQTTQHLGTNWQSFNIGQSNTVIFKQPNASSISVNRVIGTDRSEIYGNIQANGQVFLLNPNGVLFGRTAQVDVAGLLATTKTISNAEMAAGNFNHLRLIGAVGAGLANVTNLGNISASGTNGTDGYVVFAADQIFNDGTIKAQSGQIIMGAGAALDMSIEEAGSVHVKASEATIKALIDNKGLMVADGGQIILTASGKNTLLNTVINNSGTLQARSASVKNGVIVLDGGSAGVGGDVISTGVIDVSGSGAGEKGGVTILTGDRIALTGTASIDASGDGGGGRVIVGGDLLKKVTDIMDVKIAAQTVITQGVNISMGSKSGDGGFVETSGNSLTMSGNINGAAKGKGGLWLIDPTDLIIQASGVEVNTTGSPAIFQNTSSASSSTVSNASIVDALNTTDVLVTTAGGGAASGNISINADIIKTGAGVSNLTFLTASGRIELNNSISSAGGMLGLNLTANSSSLEAVRIRSTGSINVTGVLTISGTSNTNNEFAHGAVTIEGNVNASNSQNTITGTGVAKNYSGVWFKGGSQSINGNITGVSLNALSYSSIAGVIFDGGDQTLNGAIIGSSATSNGVQFSGGNQVINGSVAGSASSLSGVQFSSGNQIINGNVTGTASAFAGVNFFGSNVTLTGSVNGVSSTNFGVNFSIGNQTINGNIAGTSGTSIGVRFVNGAQVINANVTGNSSTNFGVSFNSGNQTLNGSIVGNSNTGGGVRFSAGNQTFSGNTTVTGRSNQASGISFIGGTQNFTSVAGQAVNFTGVTLNSSGASNIYGLNISGALNLTTAGGSVGLYGTANAGSGIFINANVTSLNASGDLTMKANSSTGSGFTQSGGNIVGTGNLSITANQSSTLGNISLSAGSLIANVTSGNLTLNGNLSSGKSMTLLAGSQNAAGVVTGGDVIVGTALNVTANTSGTGGTVSIYSGTPNTLNANTSVYSSVVPNETAATTSKTYNVSAAQATNASQVLNVFYRIAPNLTITAGNNSKVFDATNNTASGNYTVAGLIDGDTVNTNASGRVTAYASAAAGTGLHVNVVNTTLTMNNAVVAGYNVNQTMNATGGTISKANVTITTNGTVSNKVFDNTTAATITVNASGTAQLGNATLANGSVNASSNFTAITTSAVFTNASVGTQIVNLTAVLEDTINYTISGSTMRIGTNSAVITPAPTPAPSSSTTNTSNGLSGAFVGNSSSSGITHAQADAVVINIQVQIKNTDELPYAEDGGALDFPKGAPRGGASINQAGNNFTPLMDDSELPKN